MLDEAEQIIAKSATTETEKLIPQNAEKTDVRHKRVTNSESQNVSLVLCDDSTIFDWHTFFETDSNPSFAVVLVKPHK